MEDYLSLDKSLWLSDLEDIEVRILPEIKLKGSVKLLSDFGKCFPD